VARQRLEQGALHAAFFVTAHGEPAVTGLLARPDVSLLSIHRDAAYARKFPALAPVQLPEGLLDCAAISPRRTKRCWRRRRSSPAGPIFIRASWSRS
jgi:hypothetical protein